MPHHLKRSVRLHRSFDCLQDLPGEDQAAGHLSYPVFCALRLQYADRRPGRYLLPSCRPTARNLVLAWISTAYATVKRAITGPCVCILLARKTKGEAADRNIWRGTGIGESGSQVYCYLRRRPCDNVKPPLVNNTMVSCSFPVMQPTVPYIGRNSHSQEFLTKFFPRQGTLQYEYEAAHL
jgi:hypothetical protein